MIINAKVVFCCYLKSRKKQVALKHFKQLPYSLIATQPVNSFILFCIFSLRHI